MGQKNINNRICGIDNLVSFYSDNSSLCRKAEERLNEHRIRYRVCSADTESGSPTIVSSSGTYRGRGEIEEFLSYFSLDNGS